MECPYHFNYTVALLLPVLYIGIPYAVLFGERICGSEENLFLKTTYLKIT